MRSLKALNIKKLEHLGRQLGVKTRVLLDLCDRTDRLYRRDEIRKKSGEARVLYKPKEPLKHVQRRINALLQRVELPEYMHGCRPGHSIVNNALPHVGKAMLLNIDIKDYFPSIRPCRVYEMLSRLGCSPEVARVLTRLTTYKHHLPQGAPTSPVVSNLVFAPTAQRHHGLAEAHGAGHTNYVDDNAFSGPRHIARLEPLVCRILRESGFKVKREKVQAIPGHQEQVVTGVRVNNKIDVPSAYVEQTGRLVGEFARQGGRDGPIRRARIEGMINHCKNLNRREGRRLQRKLDQIGPAA